MEGNKKISLAEKKEICKAILALMMEDEDE